MKAIRKYLLNDIELTQKLEGEHIYLIERPEGIRCSSYVIYSYKIIESGLVKQYQITFNIIGRKLRKLLELQDRLIELLDETRQPIIIQDEGEAIKYIKLLNGGGIIKNPQTDNYEIILYFLCKV